MSPEDIEAMRQVCDRLEAADYLDRAGASLARSMDEVTTGNVLRLSTRIRDTIYEDRRHFWKTDVAIFIREQGIPLEYLVSSNAKRSAVRARGMIMAYLAHVRGWNETTLATVFEMKASKVAQTLTQTPIPGNGPVPEAGGDSDQCSPAPPPKGLPHD